MARDIAKANRAIAEAWKKEKELVEKGMGTRDWTREEQEDILATGKAHDENGKAFEGHHMQSVSYKPENQGEAGNIQFLTRDEHLAAHRGSYQNKTNGYYNYKTGEMEPFEGDNFVPCKRINLSDPVVIPHVEVPDSTEDKPESEQPNKSTEKVETEQKPAPIDRQRIDPPKIKPVMKRTSPAEPVTTVKSEKGILAGIRRFRREARAWRERSDYWIAPTKYVLSELFWKVGVPLAQQKIEMKFEADMARMLDREDAARTDQSDGDITHFSGNSSSPSISDNARDELPPNAGPLDGDGESSQSPLGLMKKESFMKEAGYSTHLPVEERQSILTDLLEDHSRQEIEDLLNLNINLKKNSRKNYDDAMAAWLQDLDFVHEDDSED